MKNFRTYGNGPYSVVVLHGGPGYPGTMVPVARELAADYGVLESLQTAGTVDGQVEELAALLRENARLPAILVGWSWGSTLALLTAARYPRLVKKLVLVCGASLQDKYRTNVFGERLDRLGEDERKEVFSLEEIVYGSAPGDKQAAMGRLFAIFAKADSYDLLHCRDEVLEYQVDIHRSVGLEAEQLYAGDRLLEILSGISCPVVAVHGDFDTHLPEGVKEPLSRVLKNFRFILLKKCGHMPWFERFARDEFFEILRKEIGPGGSGSKH